jgi:hypothetical protein
VPYREGLAHTIDWFRVHEEVSELDGVTG